MVLAAPAACAADRQWLIDGLARYSATVSLAAQADGLADPPVIGALEARYAGGLVPWVLRTTVPAWANASWAIYRSTPGVDPAQPRSARDLAALEAKTALAAQSVAGWMGEPTWNASLRVFLRDARGRCGTWQELQQAVADVSGLDLSWFFDEVFASGRVFDYGVEQLASAPLPGSEGYRTELVLRRHGDATFTGSAEPPLPPFESGRGVEIAVRFADGSERAEHWDGRAPSRTFVYRTQSPAVSAIVDPRQMILLDRNRTNNSRTVAPKAAAAANRWSMLWTQWLQHLLLSYAFAGLTSQSPRFMMTFRSFLPAAAAGVALGVFFTLSPLTVLVTAAFTLALLGYADALPAEERWWFVRLFGLALLLRIAAILALFLVSAHDARAPASSSATRRTR